ncbi:MAG: hypothetical protein LBS32_03240, partial [Clostridiales Family XIII bacterium]|nr:hypothetical protein [Clostridiales Family XIII bacterium]
TEERNQKKGILWQQQIMAGMHKYKAFPFPWEGAWHTVEMALKAADWALKIRRREVGTCSRLIGEFHSCRHCFYGAAMLK